MYRPSPLDWISRVVMLVLAGMVSLSIIGSIAAIPSGAIEGRIGMEQPRPAVPAKPEERLAPEPSPADERGEQGMAASEGAAGSRVAMAPAPPEEPSVEEWLEAITYALLALVGLAALATVIAWRSLAHRRRIADALEALSSRPGI